MNVPAPAVSLASKPGIGAAITTSSAIGENESPSPIAEPFTVALRPSTLKEGLETLSGRPLMNTKPAALSSGTWKLVASPPYVVPIAV